MALHPCKEVKDPLSRSPKKNTSISAWEVLIECSWYQNKFISSHNVGLCPVEQDKGLA